MPDLTQLVSIIEASASTGTHTDTIRRAITRGELRSVREPNSAKIFIDPVDLQQWYEATYSPRQLHARSRIPEIVMKTVRRALRTVRRLEIPEERG